MSRLKVLAALFVVALATLFVLATDLGAMAQPATSVGATVTTTAPVTSTTTIQTGTYAGQALLWVLSVFGTAAGVFVTNILMKVAKNLGIKGTDMLRARLQEIVVNGMNAGAKWAADSMAGKGKIEVQNAIVKYTVDYAQMHGAETLKALGEQPGTAKAIDAIKARIETAIADPSAPTPAVLDKTAPAIVEKAAPAKTFDPSRTGI